MIYDPFIHKFIMDSFIFLSSFFFLVFLWRSSAIRIFVRWLAFISFIHGSHRNWLQWEIILRPSCTAMDTTGMPIMNDEIHWKLRRVAEYLKSINTNHDDGRIVIKSRRIAVAAHAHWNITQFCIMDRHLSGDCSWFMKSFKIFPLKNQLEFAV